MRDFLVGLLLNMLFRWKWALLAAICFGLHLWLGVPIYFTYIILGFWLVASLAITVIMAIACRTDSEMMNQPTKNPYAKKTSDFYKDGKFVG